MYFVNDFFVFDYIVDGDVVVDGIVVVLCDNIGEDCG